MYLMLAVMAPLVSAKDIYVSKSGNNEYPGTKEKPVADLLAARDLIRQFKQNGQYKNEGFTVWVDGGVYEQKESFVLTELDSGTADYPVAWKAIPGKEVRISGGVRIPVSAVREVKSRKVLARLSREAKTHVREIDLASLGIRDLGMEKQYGHALPVVEAPLELIYNDQVMTIARYPNEGYMKIGEIVDKGSVPRIRDYSNKGGIFHYTDKRHEKWAGLKDVWFQGTFNYGYADDNIPVEYIDTKKGVVKLRSPHLYGLGSGQEFQHYYARNILDELDMPGEYYVDKEKGILYFWAPEQDGRETSISVSILEDPIVCMEGVKHVSLENFIVEVGRGIGIYMERAENNKIAGCTVRNVGTCGIFMGLGARQKMNYITHDDYDGYPTPRRVGSVHSHEYKYTVWNRMAGRNNLIKSCDVYNTGASGIYMGGGDKKTLLHGNNVADNCRVYDYGRRNKFCWAGININGCGNIIRHCEIFRSEWQGIYVRGNDHLFEYNNIHHVTLNSNDTSPWYIGRNPSDCGNVLRYNYFHHCGNENRMNMGIYCDDSSADVTAYGNVFFRMKIKHGMMFSNTGWNLKFRNNIVIEPSGPAVYGSGHYYTWAKSNRYEMFKEGGLIRERMTHEADIYSAPYSERYPFLSDYLNPIVKDKEWEGARMRYNVASENLIVKSKDKPLFLVGDYAQFEWLNNWQTDTDPGFVDYQNEDFNLKPESEVFKKIKGFKALPFSEMGLYKDEYRTQIIPFTEL